MPEHDRLAEEFELRRPRLTAVAYRILSSYPEAEDAVQETWIKLSRTEFEQVQNLTGWLTTVVSRVCLNVLRTRARHPEDLLPMHIPDPVLENVQVAGPEDEAVLADSVSLALLILLDALAPAERVAFVLHDMFDLTFDEIAPVLGRTAVASRQLASRARRRVQGAKVGESGADPATRRVVVNAFFAAARDGDLDGLLAVLDPDVELRADGGRSLAAASAVVGGAVAVSQRAVVFRQPGIAVFPLLVNGTPGAVVSREGKPVSVMGFTFDQDRIVQIQILLDPERLDALGLAALGAL